MSTIRLQIVDAIAAALGEATNLTPYRNLDFALEAENLPALVVISGPDRLDETPAPLSVMDQTAELEIVVLVANSANPEAAADPYEAFIHAALMAATDFGGHSVLMNRGGGAWSFDLGDCAARHLSYRVGYRTSFTNLET
jgi:hypothetical protein